MPRLIPLLIALCLGAPAPLRVAACPFCAAETQTLTEELADCEVAIFAKLLEAAPGAAPTNEASAKEAPDGLDGGVAESQNYDPNTGRARFAVIEALKGAELVEGTREVEAIFFGDPTSDTLYLIRGIGDPYEWTIPFEVSEKAAQYIRDLKALPESGPKRTAYFFDFLQDEDPLLAQDAYEEFARAPYSDLKANSEKLKVETLWQWINSPETSPSRRRLYFTMLGIAGGPQDVPQIERMLLSDVRVSMPAAEATAAVCVASGGPLAAGVFAEMVASKERHDKLGLDAMTACYLALRGPEGLEVIDGRYLADQQADYSHIYSVLMALRFLAEEPGPVPMDRVLKSARLLLDHPDFADQVVTDLARWEDWDSLDRLVELFIRSSRDSRLKYVREPVVNYLDVAAQQPGAVGDRARGAQQYLEAIDPESFVRARRLGAFGALAMARGGGTTATGETRGGGESPPAPPATFEGPDLPPAVSAEDGIVDPAIEAGAPSFVNGEEAAAGVEALRNDPAADPDPSPSLAEVGHLQGEKSGQDEETAEPINVEPTPEAPTQLGAPVAAPAAPNRFVLLATPIAAFVFFVGFFWIILRGGI